MFNKKPFKRLVFSFRHFDGKSYSAFNSLKCEVRIGVLSVSTLLMAHYSCLAARVDSVRIAADSLRASLDMMIGETQITGSALSQSQAKAWSKIVVVARDEIERAKCQTINDVLKLCPNVDVRQRGAFGVQTDISLGGGTFDQVTILINGININNPQTGHHSALFAVSPSDIERIEILDGASARTFGSQALNGIINIITRLEPETSLKAHAEAGTHGTWGGGANMNFSSKQVRNHLSSDYFQSDGATENSAFSRHRLFYQGRYSDELLRVGWQAAYSSLRYGANTFYSPRYPNQWEENQRYMTALTAQTLTGRVRLSPQISFSRNYDYFQLIHHASTGENYHRNDVVSVRLIGQSQWLLGRTAFGAELRHEGIVSTNLGRPLAEKDWIKVEHKSDKYYDHRDNRTNASYFLEHAVVWDKLSFNLGLMTNRNSAVDETFRFYPGLDISYRPAGSLKLFFSVNKSMRMPTFTDLYYKSPTLEGNVGLKPEQALTYKMGADFQTNWFALSFSATHRRGKNMIDWVMYSPDDLYHSAAFELSNWLLLATTKADFRKLMPNQRVLESASLSYSFNHQRRHDDTQIYQSSYALDYLRHKVTASLDHRIAGPLSATWYLRWQERVGTCLVFQNGQTLQRPYKPYTLIDLKLRWQKPRYEAYVSLSNLRNKTYFDHGSIPQPRLSVLFGISCTLAQRGLR